MVFFSYFVLVCPKVIWGCIWGINNFFRSFLIHQKLLVVIDADFFKEIGGSPSENPCWTYLKDLYQGNGEFLQNVEINFCSQVRNFGRIKKTP